MGLLSLAAYLAVLVISSVVLFLFYKSWKISKYFQSKGIPNLGVGLSGLFKLLSGKVSFLEAELLFYQRAVSKGGIVGFNDTFVKPSLHITDLNIARHIYVKDFDHFVNRRQFTTQDSGQLMAKMLIGLENQQWKGMRSKLSPIFTTGKIRKMFGILEKSSQRMVDFLAKRVGTSGDVDFCEAYSKYAMDVIASCAFGVNSKTFEVPDGTLSEFESMGNKFQFRINISLILKFMLILASPRLANALGIEAFDPVPQEYFKRVIKEVMKRRRETGERQDDFLQLMMDAQTGLLKGEENSQETMQVMTGSDEASEQNVKSMSDNSNSGKLSFDDDDIVANCVLFLIGGFETTQSVLLFAAYQLALEQQVQENLFKEVANSFEKNGGKLTYDAILGMSYLDMFIHETLRYYPPATRTERMCTKDYKIPGTDIVIDKGILVSLPVLGMHRDPQYYENPDQFDPERFLPERKSERQPYAFAPFGHGPRNCIGMRFALMEVKAVIATLVYNFKVEPCSRTDIPIKVTTTTAIRPKNGMWLKIHCRQGARKTNKPE